MGSASVDNTVAELTARLHDRQSVTIMQETIGIFCFKYTHSDGKGKVNFNRLKTFSPVFLSLKILLEVFP